MQSSTANPVLGLSWKTTKGQMNILGHRKSAGNRTGDFFEVLSRLDWSSSSSCCASSYMFPHSRDVFPLEIESITPSRLSLVHTRTLSLSHTHAHAHAQIHTHSLSHTRTRTNTHTRTARPPSKEPLLTVSRGFMKTK